MGRLEAGAIANPTPGPNDSPASAAGTPNNVGHIFRQNNNPVITYSVPIGDTGRVAVVNVTQPGHELFPGYIVQYGVQEPSTGQVNYHVAGEGANWSQSNLNPIARSMERSVWTTQRDQIRKGGYK